SESRPRTAGRGASSSTQSKLAARASLRNVAFTSGVARRASPAQWSLERAPQVMQARFAYLVGLGPDFCGNRMVCRPARLARRPAVGAHRRESVKGRGLAYPRYAFSNQVQKRELVTSITFPAAVG